MADFLHLVRNAFNDEFCFVKVEIEEVGRHPLRDPEVSHIESLCCREGWKNA